jgi:hypothetical protein
VDKTRTASPDVGTAGSFGARDEAELPTRMDSHVGEVPREPVRGRRSWFHVAAKIVRDAAIAVALMATVPVVIVAARGDRIWDNRNFTSHVRARLKQADVSRSLALPADPSITATQAGLAFSALMPTRESADFPAMEIASRPEATWRTAVIAPGMFTNAAPDLFHGPSSKTILEAVSRGFSANETAFLHTLATAPVWRDFDIVARARAVDVIGGQLKIPFAPTVTAERMPLTDFKVARELAYAAVSRAAYHMSIGQRDSAETVLRSIVSVGYAMIDNSTNLMDELIGNTLVGIGRDGLRRYFVITHDPRADAPALAQPDKSVTLENSAGARPSFDVMRRQLIAQSADPSVARGERFEALRQLSVSSCTNVRELMFGPSTDVTNAIGKARGTLARYPSEQALVDLLGRQPELMRSGVQYNPIQALAVSSATVAGVVLRNPRLASCTRLVAGYYFGGS